MAKKKTTSKKKPRTKKVKKDLDISIDGEVRDLDVTRKDGETTIEYDGKHLDFTIKKDKDGTTIDVDVEGSGLIKAIATVVRTIKAKRG